MQYRVPLTMYLSAFATVPEHYLLAFATVSEHGAFTALAFVKVPLSFCHIVRILLLSIWQCQNMLHLQC